MLAFAGKVRNIGPAITTLTLQPGTDVACEDTKHLKGTLKPSNPEFINTGCGAWHQRR
jgi:hypothetical protein